MALPFACVWISTYVDIRTDVRKVAQPTDKGNAQGALEGFSRGLSVAPQLIAANKRSDFANIRGVRSDPTRGEIVETSTIES